MRYHAGAGKSSLTCALCLGLAGDPKVGNAAPHACVRAREESQLLSLLPAIGLFRRYYEGESSSQLMNAASSLHDNRAACKQRSCDSCEPLRQRAQHTWRASCLQILGRADKAINFIRRGQQEAFTEVTLSSGPNKHPLVIQRRLTKDNLSKYRVNGACHDCNLSGPI